MTTRRMQKNLTVMFTDISGFTKHTEMVSRDALMKRLETHNEVLMPIIAHFDGKIVKTIGDAFLITFESPTNAVQCGLFMQHTLTRFNRERKADEQIHIKVSINSGEVTVTETDVFGDPVNVAAKIEKATNPDEIYFTEAVFLAMNKAEVPTSFVKAFRPRGAESQEIKLYKVAMDEGDERYQRIITATVIDPEKVKTRVVELTTQAEKEFSRYQDTLSALVEKQGKSSRNLVIAMIAGVAVLAVVIVIAVWQFGGQGAKTDPAEQLSQNVRTYLANKRPIEARQIIDVYVKEHGADKKTEEMLVEIRGFEINQLIADARASVAKGEPENAKAAILKYFGAETPTGEPAKIVEDVNAYLRARSLLENGEAEAVLKALRDLFGDTAPGEDVRALRARAEALIEGGKLMASPDRYKEPARLIGLVSSAFGNEVRNTAALKMLEEGLANELYRVAAAEGYDKAAQEQEIYRKKFTNMPSWKWINICMAMGYRWWVGINERSDREFGSKQYWDRVGPIGEYIKGKPDLLYRWGTLRFILDRKNNLIAASGTDSWLEAVNLDPAIVSRHAEFWQIYETPLSDEAAVCARDLKSALEYSLCLSAGPIAAARELVKLLYYKEMQPTLIKFANSKIEEGIDSERLNSFVILAEKGDALLIEDRYWLFRKAFNEYVFDSQVTQEQMRWLFMAPMTAENYREFRIMIDANILQATSKEGRYGTYPSGLGKVQALASDLKAAQPEHTASYEE